MFPVVILYGKPSGHLTLPVSISKVELAFVLSTLNVIVLPPVMLVAVKCIGVALLFVKVKKLPWEQSIDAVLDAILILCTSP